MEACLIVEGNQNGRAVHLATLEEHVFKNCGPASNKISNPDGLITEVASRHAGMLPHEVNQQPVAPSQLWEEGLQDDFLRPSERASLERPTPRVP